jgi:hypothetical protein
MSKLITAKINCKKINKALLYEGEKGTYLNLSIWINDTPDQYGNDISIQQYTKQGEAKIYLGEGKFYVKPEATPLVSEPEKSSSVPVKTLPPENNELDDLPF